MSRRVRTQLTPKLGQQIAQAVRGGGFPVIAAQAFGVPRAVFTGWMRRGREAGAREPYRAFAEEIDLAHAQARLRAEVAVLNDEPKFWLEHGPGRDRAGQPGWGGSVKPAEEASKKINVLEEPMLLSLFHAIAVAFADKKEIRETISEIANKHGLATHSLAKAA